MPELHQFLHKVLGNEARELAVDAARFAALAVLEDRPIAIGPIDLAGEVAALPSPAELVSVLVSSRAAPALR